MALLLEHFRDHLVSRGLVRKPAVAGVLPPLWLEPRNGAPAPGEGNNATERHPDVVIAAFMSGGVPAQRHEGFFRYDGIDIQLRARTAPLALTFESNLRATINDQRQLDMAGLTVIECLQFRPLQSLGRDEHSFDYVTEYLLQTWQQPAA